MFVGTSREGFIVEAQTSATGWVARLVKAGLQSTWKPVSPVIIDHKDGYKFLIISGTVLCEEQVC